jgi:hypothetical protein
MKARHAAAIALVSWYLVAPRVRDSGTEPPYLDTHAEYREWKVLHTFNSLDDCEAGDQLTKYQASNGNLAVFLSEDGSVLDASPEPWVDQRAEAECMEADDPRIEGIKTK